MNYLAQCLSRRRKFGSTHQILKYGIDGRIGLCAVTLLAILIAGNACAANLSQAFHSSDLHYRLTAPPGWIPASEAAIQDSAADSIGIRMVAAFQASARESLRPPMLVISHILEPQRTPADINDELSREGGIGQEGRRLVYDERRGVVMTTEPARSQEGKAFRRVTVFKPGKLGIVHLDFYLADSAKPAYIEPIVLDVLDSLRFDSGYEGQPSGSKKTVVDDILSKLRGNPMLSVSILFGVIGVASGIVRKRSSRSA